MEITKVQSLPVGESIRDELVFKSLSVTHPGVYGKVSDVVHVLSGRRKQAVQSVRGVRNVRKERHAQILPSLMQSIQSCPGEGQLIRQVRVCYSQCSTLKSLQLLALMHCKASVPTLACVLHDGADKRDIAPVEVARVDTSSP